MFFLTYELTTAPALTAARSHPEVTKRAASSSLSRLAIRESGFATPPSSELTTTFHPNQNLLDLADGPGFGPADVLDEAGDLDRRGVVGRYGENGVLPGDGP